MPEQGGTRVVRVDVTAEDIREGRRNCGSSCPIHRVEQRLRRMGQYAQEDAQTQRALAFEHARHLVLTAGGRCSECGDMTAPDPSPAWITIGATTPSGKRVFACTGCGALSPAPEKTHRCGDMPRDTFGMTLTSTRPEPTQGPGRDGEEYPLCPYCGDDLADPEYARRIFAHEADTAEQNARSARDAHLRRCRTQRWWEVFVRLVAKYPEEGVAARFADRIVDGGADHLRGEGSR